MSEGISNENENEKQVSSVSKDDGKSWVWWVFWSLVVLVSLFVLIPALMGTGKSGHFRGEAMMNVKQVGLALFCFEGDYGSYPNEATIAEVKKMKGIDLTVLLGTKSSNDFFRQLFVAGYLDQEGPFWARCASHRMPDNHINGAKLLETGECGFSYVVWDPFKGLPSNAPLVMTPLVPGKREFDYKTAKEYYGKSVIVLHCDNSVSSHQIDSDGRVMIDGKDFFDPSQPYWGGQTPRIVWPE